MQEKNTEKSINNELFGTRLRKSRTQKGLSQISLALKLGYKRSGSISNIEKGKSPPDINALIKIAEILDADLHYLIIGKPSPGEQRLEIDYLLLVGRLAEYVSKSLYDTLGWRNKIVYELTAAEKKLSEGQDVGALIENLKIQLKQTDSALVLLAKDQPWVQGVIRVLVPTKGNEKPSVDLGKTKL